MTDTRDHRHEIEIDAPPDAVWRALSDEQELTRWYVEHATVEPRRGGLYRASWGELGDATARIELWEPPRRLRLVEKLDGSTDSRAEPMVEEYTLETRGGKTVLRLVHAGIPDTRDWDAFYVGTDVGWELFLAALRHYLERHDGKPRHATAFTESLPLPAADAWSALTGEGGYRAAGLDGEVLRTVPGRKALLTTVAALDDGLLELGVTADGEATRLYSLLAAFGDTQAAQQEAAARWREHVATLG